MNKRYLWAAAGLLATVLAGLTFAAPDNPAPADKPAAKDKPAADKPTTFQGRVAAGAKVSEEEVNKVLKALGPVVRDQLAHGSRVDLPGLGAFRVVRIPEHRDLVNGRPATIAANNYIEFVPGGTLVDVANSADAVPQDTVQPFEFNPLPDQTPSQHVPNERMPNVRVR